MQPCSEDSERATMLAARTGENLTQAARTFRDVFVREYIVDFNGIAALRRMGLQNTPAYLSSRSSMLLQEPYVANRLKQLVHELQPSDIVTRNQVLMRLWEEANDYNNRGKDRITALAYIGNMLGMNKTQVEPNTQPAGVLLIPFTSEEDWAMLAANTQRALKQGAVIDTDAHVIPMPPQQQLTA